MRKNPWCSIAPKPTGVRPHCLFPLSNCGSSNSCARRRGPPYGIQSIYFRTGVKDVLTLLVNSGYGLTKPSCPLSRQAVLTYGTGLNQQSQDILSTSAELTGSDATLSVTLQVKRRCF